MRKRRSARERERLFKLHGECCYLCSEKIKRGETWDLEHVVAWILTRDESDDNVRPAHKACHAPKTADDIRGIRKADRIRQKNNGTWPKPIRKLQSRGFTRALAAKGRMNG